MQAFTHLPGRAQPLSPLTQFLPSFDNAAYYKHSQNESLRVRRGREQEAAVSWYVLERMSSPTYMLRTSQGELCPENLCFGRARSFEPRPPSTMGDATPNLLLYLWNMQQVRGQMRRRRPHCLTYIIPYNKTKSQ